MSANPHPTLPPPTEEPNPTRVEGFGMACYVQARRMKVSNEEELSALFKTVQEQGQTLGFHGSGASYGDAALNTNQIVCDMTSMNKILDWNSQTGILCAEGGATIAQIWPQIIGDGYWLPVVSGTMVPTIGGAISMNIHGKNCWRYGPIGEYVISFRLMTPNGKIYACSPEENSDIFHAAIGGFGMLGCITQVTLKLKSIDSGLLEVRAHSSPSFDDLFALFETATSRSDYVVGWIDSFAKGKSLGRGLIHEARYLGENEDTDPQKSLNPKSQELPKRIFGIFPKSWMWLLLLPFTNRPGMRFVNTVKYWLGRIFDHGKPFKQGLVAFNFLLDYIPNWKKVYLPGGFIQHQSFIPAEYARKVVPQILEITHRHRIPPYLAVFKRHRKDAFLLSHGLDGYSLALDFPIDSFSRGRILEMTRELDGLICSCGGRFYAAKDATLQGESFRASLPEDAIRNFLALKTKLDPQNLIQTDLGNRYFQDGPLNPGIL